MFRAIAGKSSNHTDDFDSFVPCLNFIAFVIIIIFIAILFILATRTRHAQSHLREWSNSRENKASRTRRFVLCLRGNLQQCRYQIRVRAQAYRMSLHGRLLSRWCDHNVVLGDANTGGRSIFLFGHRAGTEVLSSLCPLLLFVPCVCISLLSPLSAPLASSCLAENNRCDGWFVLSGKKKK